jgi:hypothetical protein
MGDNFWILEMFILFPSYTNRHTYIRLSYALSFRIFGSQSFFFITRQVVISHVLAVQAFESVVVN